jgi:hypothetical protein
MALTVTVTISDDDKLALDNDLLDIDDWVQKSVAGKINNCKKRMALEATQVLKADASVANMPADNDGLIAALAARDDYKNRVEREEE